MAMGLPEYHDMEWRFDVQLASRSILQQADPQLLLRLHVKDGGRGGVTFTLATFGWFLYLCYGTAKIIGKNQICTRYVPEQ